MSETTTAPPLTRTVRLGYHGSAEVAHRITALAALTDVAVELSQYDIADPFRGLRQGELDVAIVKFGLREPDLAISRVLGWDARAVVVGAEHPLAAFASGSVSVEDVAEYEAFHCPGLLPGYVWDEVVPPYTPGGRPIVRRHQVDAIPQMLALVASGVAVHLSLASLADIAPPTIRVVPVHDLPPAPVALCWHRGTDLPFHVRKFITSAEAEASR
ncbi:DNA-binding transcriptional LysR family regulator [Kitasatospora gansuensis]|uniref:DNA-binding transcriptional LysR family regulator n=1 Tax=Kitasatospora gansuensis TaxID=258050 RepID=A0A7W7S744_9ACTN|nr:LysR substrate-binding domain-containing protein [Kitasatospora gansuensis]MBB4945069.1 DNA-binding transcriptional LysR family regulator [Kitasatospora gansuensis]